MVSVYQRLAVHLLDQENELHSKLWGVKKALVKIERKRRKLERYKSSRCGLEFHGELLEKYNAQLLRYAADERMLKTKECSLQARLARCERRSKWLRVRLERRRTSAVTLIPSATG